jgi:hypothetical protein
MYQPSPVRVRPARFSSAVGATVAEDMTWCSTPQMFLLGLSIRLYWIYSISAFYNHLVCGRHLMSVHSVTWAARQVQILSFRDGFYQFLVFTSFSFSGILIFLPQFKLVKRNYMSCIFTWNCLCVWLPGPLWSVKQANHIIASDMTCSPTREKLDLI